MIDYKVITPPPTQIIIEAYPLLRHDKRCRHLYGVDAAHAECMYHRLE